MPAWFVTFIYQPFFNLLVGIYWLLSQIPNHELADMGVAVVIFSLALRFLLLPLTISATRSAKERHEIEEKVKELKTSLPHNPVQLKTEIKQVLQTNRRVVIAEIFNLAIQVAVALMLWRIFAKGLLGEDLHLIYGFMPDINLPFNLKFLGRFDLTHSNLALNFIQSLLIFLVESFALITSPFPVNREEVIRLQFILPVIAFFIFLGLPAGKKLFIITSLVFSLVYMIIRQFRYWLYRPPAKETPAPATTSETNEVSKS